MGEGGMYDGDLLPETEEDKSHIARIKVGTKLLKYNSYSYPSIVSLIL